MPDELVPAPMALRPADQGDIFADPDAFAHWQRVAALFAASEIVPAHLRGHMPDVMIGLDLARRLQMHPVMVLQNLYVVKGTPGWRTSFLIALANRAGWQLDYRVVTLDPPRVTWQRDSKPAEAPNLSVQCIMSRGGRVLEGLAVTTQQAIAARWANNEQYVHSTELMLRYRAAAFAIRLHDPGLLLGLQTVEEIETVTAAPVQQKPERVVLTGVDALDAALRHEAVELLEQFADDNKVRGAFEAQQRREREEP